MTVKDRLQKILKWKKSSAFYAKFLNISEKEVNRLRSELKSDSKPIKLDNKKSKVNDSSFEEDIEKGTATLSCKIDSEIKTLDELIDKCRIDITKWDIVRYVQNYWGNSNYPCWQVKAFLSAKQVPKEKIVVDFLSTYKSTYKPTKKSDIIINDVFGRDTCLLVDMTDFHLDKQGYRSTETIEEKIELYKKCLDGILYRAYRSHKLDEIVFVVGSDFFHTDNFWNQTTNGTPQDVSTTWDAAYALGFDLQVFCINKLKQFCNKLNVVLVQGNHDRQKSFYLAHSLSKYFESNDNIVFDIETKSRKVYTYGNSFIGLHHGDCKIDTLPLVFSQEFGYLWGNTKYHEILVGDKHFYFEKEIAGVRIKQLPCLSNTDRWHDMNNYVQNIRGAIGVVYDKEKGKISEFEERP